MGKIGESRVSSYGAVGRVVCWKVFQRDMVKLDSYCFSGSLLSKRIKCDTVHITRQLYSVLQKWEQVLSLTKGRFIYLFIYFCSQLLVFFCLFIYLFF